MEVKEILIIFGLLIFAVTVAVLITGEIPAINLPNFDISSIFDKETPQTDLTTTTVNTTNKDAVVTVTETQPMGMTVNMTMGFGGGEYDRYYYNKTNTSIYINTLNVSPNMTMVYYAPGGGGSFDPSKDKVVPV